MLLGLSSPLLRASAKTTLTFLGNEQGPAWNQCSSTPSISRTGSFKEEQGIKLRARSPGAVNLSSCTTADLKLNLLSSFQKYSRPEKLPGLHPTPSSPVVYEKEHANICMYLGYMRVGTEILPCAIIERLWLCFSTTFFRQVYISQKALGASQLWVVRQKHLNVGDLSHGFARLDKPRMDEYVAVHFQKILLLNSFRTSIRIFMPR